MVWYYEIGLRQPLHPRRLSSETSGCVGPSHSAIDRTLESDLVTTIDDNPVPIVTETVTQDRHFDDDHRLYLLHSCPDGVEDVGMGDRFQRRQLVRVAEND